MRWYVQPGRQLAYGPQEYDLDTPSLVSVTYRQDPKTAARSYRPADTDSLARTIAAALNVCGVTPDRPDTPLPLLLAAPMTGWAVDAATMTPEARTDLSQRLDALIERAARLRGYVDSVTECADIVGFAYPQHVVTF